jgi:hypothetical protein
VACFLLRTQHERRATQGDPMAKTKRKYSKKASKKVARAMRERKKGTLRSGSTGKKVTSRKQAIAIGLSEARREGEQVPENPRRKTKKKTARRGAPKNTTHKKTTKKRSKRTGKKSTTRKTKKSD